MPFFIDGGYMKEVHDFNSLAAMQLAPLPTEPDIQTFEIPPGQYAVNVTPPEGAMVEEYHVIILERVDEM